MSPVICVSIGRGRSKHMRAEHEHLVQQGAQLVELRIDFITGKADVKGLLDGRPGPVIVTCRRQADGGRFEGTEEERLQLLRVAIAEGAEYVDLEEDVAAQIPRYGKTQRIVSLHDFRRTPEDLPQIHQRLAALDADIVKIATLAHVPHDNVRMLQLIRDSSIPTVGLCMGDVGQPTRILGLRYGAPFTFATFSSERQMAPGQLTFEEMRDLYRCEQINDQTEFYGVIGDPIVHSYSPLIHNTAFTALNMNRVYLPIRIPRQNLLQFLDDAPGMGIRGLSVTIPHKEGVLEKLTEVDEEVRGAGAANTIIFQGDQRLGYNTDLRAAVGALEEAIGGNQQETSPVNDKLVLVLGAGGAAKAIAFGLQQRGARIVLASRTKERSMELAHRLKCRAVEWDARHNVHPQIIINCTPVGMHPNVDQSPLDKHYLRPTMVVFDTVYNPESTMLVKHARAQNCKVITGIEMFVRQGALQFKLFTGQEPPEEAMREVLRRAIAPVKT